MAPLLDRAIDAFAMWTEDRRARASRGFREAAPAPLLFACRALRRDLARFVAGAAEGQ